MALSQATEMQIEPKAAKIDEKIRSKLGNHVDVIFFNSESNGCWIHPLV